MTWLFSEINRNIKRRFISFTECTINGTWVPTNVTVDHLTYHVYEAKHDSNCEVIITEPDGTQKRLLFKLRAHISIEQSMLLFIQDDVAEESIIA